MRKLLNETAVLDLLRKNIAENSGIYLFPGALADAGSRSIVGSHRLLVEFLNELAEAVLAVFLLSLIRLTTFGARLTFVQLVGVLAAIATNVAYSIWYGFPWSYTLAYMFIQIVGFLCIGLVAALVLRKQSFGVSSARGFLQEIWRAIVGGQSICASSGPTAPTYRPYAKNDRTVVILEMTGIMV